MFQFGLSSKKFILADLTFSYLTDLKTLVMTLARLETFMMLSSRALTEANAVTEAECAVR